MLNTMTANQYGEIGNCEQPSLLDQLLARRAQIAKDTKARIAKLDREINLLRQSDAEQIVKGAKETLEVV